MHVLINWVHKQFRVCKTLCNASSTLSHTHRNQTEEEAIKCWAQHQHTTELKKSIISRPWGSIQYSQIRYNTQGHNCRYQASHLMQQLLFRIKLSSYNEIWNLFQIGWQKGSYPLMWVKYFSESLNRELKIKQRDKSAWFESWNKSMTWKAPP